MAFGGAISYSIYLNHFFTLNVIHALRAKYCGVNPLSVVDALYLYVVCALVLTLAFSTLTYYIVEKPFLKKKRSYVLNDAPA